MGNLPLLPAVFPDPLAPVIRLRAPASASSKMMRRGVPPPSNLGKAPLTKSATPPRPICAVGSGRLVPATSFCELTDGRPKGTHWFAVDRSRHSSPSPESGGFPAAHGARRLDIWLSGSLDEALKLQRTLPDHELQIVAKGAKDDAAPARA
jgi:hypothetical protein